MRRVLGQRTAKRLRAGTAACLIMIFLITAALAEGPEAGWEACKETTTDFTWTGVTDMPKENGSKEITADSYEIYRYTGTPRDSGNVFTAFDEDDTVIGYVTFADSPEGVYDFICPMGTTKIAVPAEEGNPETPSAIRRKTGLTMAVMGDSISTFIRYNPEGYKVYYLGYNCDVPSASWMWWGITARELGYRISVINAWSGSLVSTAMRPEASMCMERTEELDTNGEPDIILIMGGVNDFLEGVPLGEWNGTSMPESGATFREAYALMLDKILRNYPRARVYCCTLAACDRNYVPCDLENLEGQYLYEFNDAIREIAGMFHCGVIDVSSCGITAYNLETYMGDFDPDNSCALHPNRTGQELIAQQVIRSLK